MRKVGDKYNLWKEPLVLRSEDEFSFSDGSLFRQQISTSAAKVSTSVTRCRTASIRTGDTSAAARTGSS